MIQLHFVSLCDDKESSKMGVYNERGRKQ